MVISKKVQIRLNVFFVTIAILFIGVFSMYELGYLDELLVILAKDNYIFYWMLLIGFLAEIVAGSMGMGYGVICTTTLLFLNIPPHIVSASIHSAESFTTAAGSISHIKLKNVSKSLVKKLAIPAVIGAVIGALSLTYLGEYYSKITKTVIAFYTLYLGFQILSNAFKSKQNKSLKRKTNLTRLGAIGGFIDSFAGGGWGPLVTGTLIKNAFTPRFAVGSSTVAKFILTLTSAITFFFTLGIQHWNIILGLLIGGIITAPFSAMLTSRLPVKKMFVIIGTLVIVMSSITIYKSVFN
ncbi:sulfite exporter TauE/SafE family protein [Chryseobacterium soli]|uniref:sulfite exporter TauE/SafE family protein n=1 Tax=Chryseobacterium soli TaxID=445961 RepID=UPI002954E024|nr:sulfite exporter TauE/SafE family protein [Chryseobacterium soli]MDV7699496.1 sulfite exporter TauE/SafE family protein [Chryseobacterium soli]